MKNNGIFVIVATNGKKAIEYIPSKLEVNQRLIKDINVALDKTCTHFAIEYHKANDMSDIVKDEQIILNYINSIFDKVVNAKANEFVDYFNQRYLEAMNEEGVCD
ncbi:MAG: hypothetical protein MJ211_07670 [Bacteroidales bacterium]|nr:hypothetical protein [Bacteroidales bacterium]